MGTYHRFLWVRLFCVSRTARIRLLRLFTLWFERKQRICAVRLTAYAVCVQRILSKMALRWCRWDKLLNKVIIFIFFAYKKYSRRFIKFRLNHWWQMDYFGDVFHTFLGLDSAIYLAVNGTVKNLPVFIQNILNCVPKTNKAFTGLERHGGKWLMAKFSFWGGVTL